MLRVLCVSLLLPGIACAGWTVEVTATAPGLSAEEVERLVTIPLEAAFTGVQGVRLAATTMPGRTVIALELAADADRQKARQAVAERLKGVPLPAGVLPIVAVRSPVQEPAFWLAVTSRNLPDASLTRLVEAVVVKTFQELPRCGGIEVVGAVRRELQVTLHPARLQAYALDPVAVADALAGFKVERTDDLGSLVLARVGGNEILLRDVAESRDAVSVTSRGMVQGRRALLVGVQAQEDGDQKRLGTAVAAALTALRPRLPEGVEIDLVAEPPDGILRVTFPPEVPLARATHELQEIAERLPPKGSDGRTLTVARATPEGVTAQVLLTGAGTAPDEAKLAALRQVCPGAHLRWVERGRLNAREQTAFVLELPVADLAAGDKLAAELLGRLGKAGEAARAPALASSATTRLRLERDKLADLGLTPERVMRTVDLSRHGVRISGTVAKEAVAARVELDGRGELLDLPLQTAAGKTVPLRQVATLERTTAVTELRRAQGQRVILITFDPRESKNDAVPKVLGAAVGEALQATGTRLSGEARLWPADAEKPILLKP